MLEENPEAVQRRAATKKASLPVLQLGAPGLMACFAQVNAVSIALEVFGQGA